MQRVDLSKPGERKKLIGAAVLGVVAIAFLYWVLIGFDSGAPATTVRPASTPAPQQRPSQNAAGNDRTPTTEIAALARFTEIKYEPSSYNAP